MKQALPVITILTVFSAQAGAESRLFTALLADGSKSSLANCSLLAELASSSLDQDMSDVRDVSIFVTGNAETAMEPRMILTDKAVRDTRFVKGASKASETRSHIEKTCGERFQREDVSAIYNGVRSVAEDLQETCRREYRCTPRLIVLTDGEESEVLNLKNALLRGSPVSVPKIDNDQLDITFCGLAETVGVRGSHNYTPFRTPVSHTRLRRVWSAVMTHPEKVGFRNFCEGLETDPKPSYERPTENQLAKPAPPVVPTAIHPAASTPPAPETSSAPARWSVSEANPRAALKRLVETAQRENVRLSWGSYQGECYTDQNLEEDISRNKPQRIADALMRNNEFLAIAAALRRMPPEERTVVANSGRAALHQTWTERGVVDANGQSSAGKQMELMISNAIVDQLLHLADR